MSNNNSVRPEDVLPDGLDNTSINGKTVRKGTIAAFLAKAEILENPNASKEQKQGAVNMMSELAPAVVALGLHKHVIFKNPQVEQILINAETTQSFS